MEKRVEFESQGFKLEGLLFAGDMQRAAIILHPHPLYGGDMNNAVVAAIAQTYQDEDWTSLRFNFRGTGNSSGIHDNGVGERMDIDAAAAYLQKRGIKHLDLVGYSFGAWVLAGWARENVSHNNRIVLVAPPVDFVDFSDIHSIAGLHAVIVGDADNFAPLHQVEAQMNQWCDIADLTVITRADHFFGGKMGDLKAAITDIITNAFPS